MADKNDDFMTEARNRFMIAADASSDNRKAQLDDVRFAAGSPDNGWQWPEDVRSKRMNDPNGARPVLTMNMLPQHIRQVTNEQRQNRPAGKILPVDDKGDPEVAEVFNGIVRHIEVSSHADVAYDGACENQVTSGEGYWRLLTEYCDETSFDLDIVIAAIRNPFSVYMDPDGLRLDSTGRKCQWTFITSELSNDDYERQFPNAKTKTDWDQLAIGDSKFEWFEADRVTIAEYFSYIDEKKTLCLCSDGATRDVKEPLPEGVTHTDKTREMTVLKVKWAKINGMEVLEEQEWPGKYIPVIRVAGNEWDVEGKIIVSGLVRNAKDPQRMLNYWTSQEAEMLALAPKAPFIGAVGQFETMSEDWKQANTVNFSRLEYDPISVDGIALPAPQRQQPVLPPTGIIHAKMESADDLKAVTGQFDPSLGNNPQSKSGIALQREQRKSEVGTFHYIDNLSRSIGYSTEQIVDLIPKIYDQQRVARIIGEDGEPDHAILAPTGQAVTQDTDEQGAMRKIYDPSVGRYDVVVTVGPSFTTKRIEAVDGMVQLTQANPNLWGVIGDLIVRNMDWPGAEEMAKRIKKTMPQEIVGDEDDDPNAVEAQMQKIKAAVMEIGKREAELNAHAEQLQMASDQAKQESEQAAAAEQKAKDAIFRVNDQISKLNEMQSAIENERSLFKLEKELAQKEIEMQSLTLDSEREIARAEVKALKVELEGKQAEVSAQIEGQAKEEKAGSDISQLRADLQESIDEIRRLATADRVTEIEEDEDGNPIRGVSRLVVDPQDAEEQAQREADAKQQVADLEQRIADLTNENSQRNNNVAAEDINALRQELQAKIDQVAQIASAPRITELEADAEGNPIRGVSRVAMPQQGAM